MASSKAEAGLLGWLSGKEFACNAGDVGSIPGSERSPREGNGNPLQNSCLENPMDRGAWEATVHGVARVGHNLATKPTGCNNFQIQFEKVSCLHFCKDSK